jgi:AcrR family transcriptional regulator
MPKISKDVWESRRQQILVAAVRCFARYGIQATTMEQIIAEAAMSSSAMYRYFDGKSDIVFAAISKNLHDFAEIAVPAVAKAGTTEPSMFFKNMLAMLEGFSERDGYSLKTIIVQGWGESFTNLPLGQLLSKMYGEYLISLEALAEAWIRGGIIESKVRPIDLATFMMSCFLGSIAQSCILHTPLDGMVAGFGGFFHSPNGG